MNEKHYTIYLVDSHNAILYGVTYILQSILENANIISLNSFNSLFKQLQKKRADLIIVTHDDTFTTSIEAIPRIRQIQKDIPIIIYTQHNQPSIITTLIRMQVHGIVIKTEHIEYLSKAVVSVLERGEKYFSRSILELLLALSGDDYYNDKILYSPTQREKEIITLISYGLTSKQIAEKVCLTQSTVETIRKNILTKSRSENVSHLMRVAFFKGWIT